jgi:hypothetical protein
MKIPFLAVIALLTCSSVSACEEMVTRFQKEHPEKAKLYTRLTVTTVDAEIFHAEEMLASVVWAARGAVGANQTGEVTDERAKRWIEILRKGRQGEIEAWKEAKKKMIPGDVLCIFEWRDGKKARSGHLLLNAGDIRVEWPIAEGVDFVSEGDSKKRG